MSSNRPRNGPSGSPARHFIELGSKKEAQEAARRSSSRNRAPVHHSPHQDGHDPHYHPTDAQGNKKESGAHYSYPK